MLPLPPTLLATVCHICLAVLWRHGKVPSERFGVLRQFSRATITTPTPVTPLIKYQLGASPCNWFLKASSDAHALGYHPIDAVIDPRGPERNALVAQFHRGTGKRSSDTSFWYLAGSTALAFCPVQAQWQGLPNTTPLPVPRPWPHIQRSVDILHMTTLIRIWTCLINAY